MLATKHSSVLPVFALRDIFCKNNFRLEQAVHEQVYSKEFIFRYTWRTRHKQGSQSNQDKVDKKDHTKQDNIEIRIRLKEDQVQSRFLLIWHLFN